MHELRFGAILLGRDLENKMQHLEQEQGRPDAAKPPVSAWLDVQSCSDNVAVSPHRLLVPSNCVEHSKYENS